MIELNAKMTIAEAIETMRKTRVKVSKGTVKDFESAKILLMEVAGYRVGKRPEDMMEANSWDKSYKSGFCPSCKKVVDEIEDESYCHECGQKLIWK